MDTDLRDILLCPELLEMHWRKTEAELKGYSSIAYNAMIAFYKVELAKMGKVRSGRHQAMVQGPISAASSPASAAFGNRRRPL
jgi:hypothetical protein